MRRLRTFHLASGYFAQLLDGICIDGADRIEHVEAGEVQSDVLENLGLRSIGALAIEKNQNVVLCSEDYCFDSGGCL